MELPHYGVVELKHENEVLLDKILDGFHNLENHSINQIRGTADVDCGEAELRKCGMCVGAWASFFGKYTDEEYGTWDFRVGEQLLVNVFQLSSYFDLDDLLQKHGAPCYPFGEVEWEVDPYSVLRHAAIEHFNYFHNIAAPICASELPVAESA